MYQTKATANEIERRMNNEGHTVACLTGELDGAERDTIIDRFRKGEAKVLVTTNVLSRRLCPFCMHPDITDRLLSGGIDVQTVSLVVNYDLPDDNRGGADPQVYLHRIGRTGRFGRVGVSISLVHDRRSHTMIKDISDYFDIQMTELPFNDWDSVEEVIKKVIKSSRAGKDFRPVPNGGGDMDM